MKTLLIFSCVSVALSAQTIDPVLTPGVTRQLTAAQVCATKWGLDRRHVTETMKRQVAASYKIDRKAIVAASRGPCCEFDHRIPREIGGADDVKNIWPQPWVEAHKKDVEENAYHKQVCSGAISLVAAQVHFMHWGEK